MDVTFIPAPSVDVPEARYKPLNTRTEELPAGYLVGKGRLPLSSPITVEYDTPIPMRDGVTIYADIYRPANATAPLPALISWAPYGKGGTGFWSLDNPIFPRRFGVPKNALSGLESWESPDPAYWCSQGYAIVQVDARGAFNSEGDIHYLGSGEGRDGYDTVEYIAGLEWCSGKVGMAGNSWLSMMQWHIAAAQPPHLAAIAPWEGSTDLYRDVLVRGGIPSPAFPEAVRETLYGKNKVEDPISMLEDHPLHDEYWADKIAKIEAITIPAYVVASYSNQLHPPGTFDGWRRLVGPKWLRVHNTHEWPDFYEKRNVEELRKFFDRYLRDVDNGWEKTPAVRASVLDPGNEDTVERAETAFPPTRYASKTLYLDASQMSLSSNLPSNEAKASYDLASESDLVHFTHTFERTTEIVGFPTLDLYVSADGADDLDLYVYLFKKRKGKRLLHQTLTLGLPLARKWMPIAFRRGVNAMAPAFFEGTSGVLRVSRRGLIEGRPSDARPELALTSEKRLSPGEIVKVTIPFWPIGMRWKAGETLDLVVAARSQRVSELPGLELPPRQPGRRHVVYTGPNYPSSLTLPLDEV